MMVWLLPLLLMLSGSALATPACPASYQAFLAELTLSPKTVTDFDHYEKILVDQLKSDSDEVLQKKVDAYIAHQLETKSYLPGLTPGWEVKNIQELIEDFHANGNGHGDSALHNYSGNVAASAKMARGFISSGKMPPNERFVDMYRRNMPEGLALLELMNRLERAAKH